MRRVRLCALPSPIRDQAHGHAVTETNPAGVVTRSEYDRAHRLTAVVANDLGGRRHQ